MKKTLLLFTLFATLISYSQIVTIPDANFKAALIEIGIDTNNDGEIQVSEAEAVTELGLVYKQINSLEGILSFKNLEILDCEQNNLTTLNLSSLSKLTSVICSSNNLNSINISNLTNLEVLNCGINNLSNLDLQNLPNLKELSCYSNELSNLNLTNLPNLEILSCGGNNFTNLDLTMLSNLKKLDCNGNNNLVSIDASNLTNLEVFNIMSCHIGNLNLSGLTNLNKLYYSFSNITTLDLPFLPNLEYLDCQDNLLTNLDISLLPNLKFLIANSNFLTNMDFSNSSNLIQLDLANNGINNIDVSNLPNLKKLYLYQNNLTELDVSNLIDLDYLNLNDNNITIMDLSNQKKLDFAYLRYNKLESLFIKNGNIDEQIVIIGNPELNYICTDRDEIQEYINLAINYGYTNCVVNSFCTFEPGGDVFYIKGNVKLDLENNGCNINDAFYSNIKFKVTDANNDYGIFSTDNSGEYNIALPEGQYSIEYQFPYTTYFDVSPTSFSVNFPTDASPFLQDICLTPKGSFNDLQVSIIPIEEARPGFDAKYKIVYANVGTTTLSGNVNLTFDDNVLDFVSASPSVTTQNIGHLNWSFSDLAPTTSEVIEITMNLNTPTETPPLTGDEILCYEATITPTDNDEEPNDNSFTLKQTVVNSFDPNDKTCLEGNTVTPDLIGEYVHYLIRFENTGTASAINIVVKDIIDTTKFDVSTLEVYNSSHELETRIQNTNEVEFIFEGINLPFDDATNDGYVAFKIKTLPSLAVGDIFENKAEIYFDFNAPIITNNAQTTIESTASLDEFSLNSKIEIYPNPTNNNLNIESNLLFDSLTIYDIRGRQLQTISYTDPILKSNFSTRNLTNGIYYISIQSGTSKKLLKFIKK